MSKENKIDWNLVSRIEAAYDHGMSWDLDDICKTYEIDKIKHIVSLSVGKWAELHIKLNDEGLQHIKDNGWVKYFSLEHIWEETLKSKTLTISGDEWTDDYKWPISARYLDKDWEEVYEEEYN